MLSRTSGQSRHHPSPKSTVTFAPFHTLPPHSVGDMSSILGFRGNLYSTNYITFRASAYNVGRFLKRQCQKQLLLHGTPAENIQHTVYSSVIGQVNALDYWQAAALQS